MTRSGQGIQLGQTVLELDAPPDLPRLERAMSLLIERHPAITWRPRTSFLPGIPPRMVPSSNPARAIPFHLWDEGINVESESELCHRLLNQDEEQFHAEGTTHLRCDLLRKKDGHTLVIFTWRHLMFDGTGAELLLYEAAALASGEETGYVSRSVAPQDRCRQQGGSLLSHIRASQPVRRHLENLLDRHTFRSFNGPIPRSGRGLYHRVTLDPEESERLLRLIAERCGLVTTPYFLACATKAHHRVWQRRETAPDGFLIGLPVSLRKSGAKGPLLQNNVSFMFFCGEAGDADDVMRLSGNFQQQQLHWLRNHLGESFLHLQHLMRHLPPVWYTGVLRRKMRGEFSSFYHSYTGELAPGLDRFAGAPVVNAWHQPTVFNPLSTGLFLSQKNGRLTVVTSWREGVISDEERRLLTEEFLDAMRTG